MTLRLGLGVLCASLLVGAGAAMAQSGNGHGVALGDMDRAVKPGDNFFLYANGDWVKKTVIPPDRVSVGGFQIAAEVTEKRVAEIVQDAGASGSSGGEDARLVAALYASYMDTAAIEKAGTGPLRRPFAEIEGIKDKVGLARYLGTTLRADTDALNNTNFHTANLFGLWVAPDFNDPDHYTAYLMQGGIELPEKQYYVSDSEKMKAIQGAYKAHIATMLRMAGLSDPEGRAERVYGLELAIAKGQVALADEENIYKANNPWTAAEFAGKAPGLDWGAYFAGAGLAGQKKFIVWQPTAIMAESALVQSEPLETWKDWALFHEVERVGGSLPAAFADEEFAFYGKTLSGAPEQRPRDKRGVALVNGILGDALGKIYAEKYFSAEEKAKVQALVGNLLAAFHARLANNAWMAPATKAEALKKLGTLQVGVGYPDRWRSYAGLELRADDLAGNLRRASEFDYRYEVGRIGTAVDRKEWVMEPQTVNAVNLPLDNGLNFPAAILQPPFYDPAAPDAFNYGAIGAVIGHEISHTFDSEGAAFDSKGQVRNWWTPGDLAHFEASTAALAKQYDSYMPFPDVHVNGRQTLGEDIADLAGVNDALDAYHFLLHGQRAPVVEGLTGDQQFFLAFGQNWKSKEREAALRRQVATDPHAPAEYRADTVRNLDAWYPAFSVKAGETLYLAPDQRVRIW